MARIRYLKPETAADTRLAEVSRDARLLYRDLWCHMDRQGITEDDPRLIKRNVFPYDDDLTVSAVESLINELVSIGRLFRFEWEGKKLIYCPTLQEHQKFHRDEKPKYVISQDVLLAACQHPVSTLPKLINTSANSTGNGELVTSNGERRTGNGERATRTKTVPAGSSPDRTLNARIWEAYREEYKYRYQVEPTRNATVNSQIANLGKRLGEDAPEVVRFYLRHNKAYYVQNTHMIGLLLKDAESLHTQWQRGQAVLTTHGRDAERAQHNFDVFERAAENLDRREESNVNG